VYFSESWTGEPAESDEMKPEWFALDQIPFEAMWPDDPFWLPRVLNGELLRAAFVFAEGDVILSKQVDSVEMLGNTEV
jgi:8-oxo-dGTP diphosphatase/2-hydroxy-dATP diphosphatase